MITTIIVVDSFIEDALDSTLNVLKNSSCVILKLDLYSITKENVHVKIQEHITNEMEAQTFNITKILFVNFDILGQNIETEVFLGEISKLYNLELHDPDYKSWKHINDSIVTLSKSFEIENVDIIYINHLVHYESYAKALEHVEQTATNNEAFNVNVNYLSKFCSLEDSEAILTSTNWLNTLFGTLYSQNSELKEFIDLYFQVNNTNLSFLANQTLDALDIFSKEFIEFKQNDVVISEETTDAHVMLIPVHYYENNGNELFSTMEGTLKESCHLAIIYENDDVNNVNETLKHIVDHVHESSNSEQITVNVLFHIPKTAVVAGESEQQLSLSKDHMQISFEEDEDESENTFRDILKSLSENDKVKESVMSVSNIPDSAREGAVKYFQNMMSEFESSEVKMVLDTPTHKKEQLYKPSSETKLSHQSVYYHNEVKRETKRSYSLDFVSESAFDNFVNVPKINHIILYDASLSQYLPEVYMSLTSDTEIIVYDSTENFELLKDKIRQLSSSDDVSLNNVALFKKNIPSYHFSLFDEEHSLKHDVEEDRSSWVSPTLPEDASGTDVSDGYVYDLTEVEDAIESNKNDYYSHYNGPDPSLNTWEKFSDFLLFLQDEIKVSNFDILTCKLVGPDWEYILENLQKKTPNMIIHSSIDDTGHVMFEGDWILETPNNVNLVGLYFNENIYDVKVKLDSSLFTNWNVLRTKIKELILVSSHSATIAEYGDISTWTIGSNIKHFFGGNQPLISDAVFTTGDRIWSHLDGMNNWDVSHVTSLNRAFSPNLWFNMGQPRNGFNSPIGNWNVSNVTNLDRTFQGAASFNQDLSNWDVAKVTTMQYTFYVASSFNQPIGSWNTSNVTNLTGTFQDARLFNQDINNWDVGKNTSLAATFYYAASFDQDLSSWDVRNVTNLHQTFRYARSFSKVLGGHWKNLPSQSQANVNINGVSPYLTFWGQEDDRKVIPAGHIEVDYDPVVGFTSVEQLRKALMIHQANSLYGDSLFGKSENWNVSNLTNMDNLYSVGVYKWHAINMENWDVRNVTSMEKTFYKSRTFNCDISNWDVRNVTNMKQMFYSSSYFTHDLSSWDVGNVTDMTQMFYGCTKMKWDLSGWNTANADTTNMFQNATDYNNHVINSGFTPDYTIAGSTFADRASLLTALQAWNANRTSAQSTYGHISKWNVSAVTDFSTLFNQAFATSGKLAEDLNNWDTGNVTNMYGVFYNCREVTPKIGSWNTSNVTNMHLAFNNCTYFNDNLENWDTGNVTSMHSMFKSAHNFNGNIENWDVKNVLTMRDMFHTTNSFNRDLSNWDVDNVTNMQFMFTNNEGMVQILGGKWMDIPERMNITTHLEIHLLKTELVFSSKTMEQI